MSPSAEHVPTDYDRAPGRTTLIFADDPALRGRLAASVAAAGGRVAAVKPLDGAAAALAAQAGTAALLVALAADGGTDLDRLLDRIDAGVRAAALDALVIAPATLIDVVARLAEAGTTLLIDPSPTEIATALAALVAVRSGVAEPEAGDDRRRLAELSEETARIARALASLAEERGAVPDEVAEPQVALAATRGMIRTRRLREQFFDATLFADPAWDMLLDLFAARLERRDVAVSSLCIAAAVPPTTALRWISVMTAQGLIVRRPDPTDRRRMFLALGETAAEAMAGYVAATLRHLEPSAAR